MIRPMLTGALLAVAAFAQTGPAGFDAPRPAPPKPAAPPAARPAVSRAAAGPSLKDLKFPALHAFDLARPVRFQLPNGLKVLLVENHESPIVYAVTLIRAGSVLDPAGRSGVANLTGTLLRTGGAGQKSPDRLDVELESLGAIVDSNATEVHTAVSMSVLKENLPESLALYRSILTEPAFRQDKLDHSRALLQYAIGHRNDDPRETLRREFQSLVFGKDSPYSARPDYASVARISRPDLVAYYRRYFSPANAVLALSGDFDAAALKQSIETTFGSWKNDQPPVPALPSETKPEAGGFLAVRSDIRETYFAIGHPGGSFLDKDGPAMEVAVAVLGTGAQSRLSKRGMETMGAVRELYADWRSGFGAPGVFGVYGIGRPQDTGENLKLAADEVRKLRAAEVTEDELRAAREAVLSRWYFGFDNQARALSALTNFELNGYPADVLQQFQKAVAAVTRADVLRVAKERIDPDKFTALAVSNLSVFNKPIDPSGGATKALDLTIAAPKPAETAAATPTGVELGKALLERARQAMGGAEKLLAVQDFVQVAQYRGVDSSIENQTDRWLAPGHLRQDAQSTRSGAIYRYTDGTNGWLSNGRASTALTGPLAKESRAECLRVFTQILLSDRLPGRVVTALDEQTIEITQGDANLRMVFDSQTGLPSKLLYDVEREKQTSMFVEEAYSDFRDVGGVKVPFAITVSRNGQKYADGTISEFKLNQGLKVEILQKRP